MAAARIGKKAIDFARKHRIFSRAREAFRTIAPETAARIREKRPGLVAIGDALEKAGFGRGGVPRLVLPANIQSARSFGRRQRVKF